MSLWGLELRMHQTSQNAVMGAEGSYCGNDNVLELVCGDGCINLVEIIKSYI